MNVLLVRADGIGDALACAPLIAALVDGGHDVAAVLGTRNREIFARRALRRVHVLERIPWPRHGSTSASRRAALGEVRAAGYDVALIASEEMEAYRFAVAARIPRRIGFVNGWEKPLKTVRARTLLTRAVVRPASARRVREHEVETVFRLGAELQPAARPTRDNRRLATLLLDEPVVPHGRIVLQVSLKLAADGLDERTYVATARALARLGREVLVLGDDRAAVRAVAGASRSAAEFGLDVPAWKARIAGALALITPDSGGAHVAGMLGVPCVDCFASCASTARDVMRWRPWATRERTVVLDPTRAGEDAGASLARAADELLARQSA